MARSQFLARLQPLKQAFLPPVQTGPSFLGEKCERDAAGRFFPLRHAQARRFALPDDLASSTADASAIAVAVARVESIPCGFVYGLPDAPASIKGFKSKYIVR